MFFLFYFFVLMMFIMLTMNHLKFVCRKTVDKIIKNYSFLYYTYILIIVLL